jgi:hypothetical protein
MKTSLHGFDADAGGSVAPRSATVGDTSFVARACALIGTAG